MLNPMFPAITPRKNGWSSWIAPSMNGYRTKCCGCGMVHELQFRALEQTTPTTAKREWQGRPIKNGRVEFRARVKRVTQ